MPLRCINFVLHICIILLYIIIRSLWEREREREKERERERERERGGGGGGREKRIKIRRRGYRQMYEMCKLDKK